MLKRYALVALVSVVPASSAQPACSEAGEVRSQQFIGLLSGGFAGDINAGDAFGDTVVAVGDVDGDGIVDLAVGAPLHDEPGLENAGAVFLLFLNPDGSVRRTREITDNQASRTAGIGPRFGSGLAPLGDLDLDGTPDLAVGVPGLDISGRAQDSGGVDILFLNPDGSIKNRQRIAEGSGNFAVNTEAARFGWRVGNIGDLDGDGFPEIAVGAPRTVVAGLSDVGALYVLFLLPDGTVKADRRLAPGENGLDIPIGFNDGLGFDDAITPLGDVNGDGLAEVAIGVIRFQRGSAFVLSLNNDGSVADSTPLTLEGFPGVPPFIPFNGFGASVESVGDLDSDGVIDVAISQPYPDGASGTAPGFVYIVYLNDDLTIKAFTRIGAGLNGFTGPVAVDEDFGRSLAMLPDLEGDGFRSLAIGASGGFNGTTEGGVWILELDGCATPPTITSGPTSLAVTDGQSASLSVTASGDGPLSYQWFLDDEPLSDGPGILGSTAPIISIDPADPSDAGIYTATVTSPAGTTASGPAVLAVRPGVADCPADFNTDGLADFFDLIDLLADLEAGCF